MALELGLAIKALLEELGQRTSFKGLDPMVLSFLLEHPFSARDLTRLELIGCFRIVLYLLCLTNQ